MKKILVLTTGGTIASKVNPETGLYTSGAMNADELVDRKKMKIDVDVELETFSQIPSNAMSFDLLLGLAARIRTAFEDSDVAGIVITHGTDTLEESSYFLSLCLGCDRPVVMTGSQRTPQEEGTDAYSNIQDAIIAAASPECRGLGVVVMFNEGLYSPRYVRKMHSFNPDAFTAFGFGMLGYVDGSRVHVAQRPVTREGYEPKGPLPKVEIVKASLGSDGTLIDVVTGAGAKGLVLEGFGRGHVPPGASDAVGRAVEKGVHVVITTTCEMGRVYPVYDFQGSVKDLETRGAIQGFDYAAKKARIKLAVLLASGITGREALAEAFSR